MKKEWIVLTLMLCVTILAVSQAAHAETALPEVPEYQNRIEPKELSDPEEALKYVQKLTEADFFQAGDLTGLHWDITEPEDGAWLAEAERDGQTLSLYIDSDGSLRRFDNGFSRWEEAEELDPGAMSGEVYEAWRENIDLRIIEPFVRNFNPAAMDACLQDVKVDYDSKIYFTGYHGTFEKEDQQFLWFYTDAYQNQTVRMKFVVQTLPMMRIVYFDAALDATAEGGNG